MKKPEIKINFLYYGTPFDFEKNFIVKLLKKRYKVIFSGKPDYVFFSVYKNNNKFLLEDGSVKVFEESEKSKENLLKKIYQKMLEKDFVKGIIWFLRDRKILKPYAKILDVKGDFVKIFYSAESIKPDMSKCDWAFASDYESDLNHPRYMRVPPYMVSGDHFDLVKKKQNFNQIKKGKTKFCNFIYSNHVPLRNKLFRQISKYKRVDSPGTCMNNMSPIGSYKNPNESRSSGDWMEEKLEFISEYKFTIGVENKISSGYVTEKFIDAMLINSIPIYIGHKDINKEFNTKSFINFHDFKNMKDFISYIIRVDNDDQLYKKILKEPWLNQNKPSLWMEEERLLKRFEEIFEKD